MINEMNDRIASILMRGQLHVQQPEEVKEAAPEEHQQRYTEHKADANAPQQQLSETQQQMRQAVQRQEQVQRTPIVRDKLPGRNDPCPCGSGKKFKNCHGKGL